MAWAEQGAGGAGWTAADTHNRMFDATVFDLDIFDASFDWTDDDAPGAAWASPTQLPPTWTETAPGGAGWRS